MTVSRSPRHLAALIVGNSLLLPIGVTMALILAPTAIYLGLVEVMAVPELVPGA